MRCSWLHCGGGGRCGNVPPYALSDDPHSVAPISDCGPFEAQLLGQVLSADRTGRGIDADPPNAVKPGQAAWSSLSGAEILPGGPE
jgi:hypothetical protein